MNQDQLTAEIERYLATTDHFLVRLNITADQQMEISIDGMENVTLDTCIALNHHLRKVYGEALDAYEVTVASPGLDKPFVHIKQYQKNIGKSVEIVLNDGQKLAGKITRVEEGDGFELNEFAPKKGNNKSLKPQLSDKLTFVKFTDIKQTKKLVII